MEIEKKYLISTLPFKLDQYPFEEIEQGYLCKNPVVRVRKKGGHYILTYKSREGVEKVEKLCVANEVEVPLTMESYEHLRDKADGNLITKTRYKIPYDSTHTIELDIFKGKHKGLILAEVEFASLEEVEHFIPPTWFGEDVSGNPCYSNSFLSTLD